MMPKAVYPYHKSFYSLPQLNHMKGNSILIPCREKPLSDLFYSRWFKQLVNVTSSCISRSCKKQRFINIKMTM